jgi:hypothetical protein
VEFIINIDRRNNLMPETITLRGAATSVQHMTLDGRAYRLAKSIEKAEMLNLLVAGKNASPINDKTLPVVNEGYDLEITGVTNPRSGGLEVVVLKNYTSGAEWKLSRARAVSHV